MTTPPGPGGGPYGGQPGGPYGAGGEPDSPWRRPAPGAPGDGPPGLGGGQPPRPYQPTPDYRPGYAPPPPPPQFPPPPGPGPGGPSGYGPQPGPPAGSSRRILALVGGLALVAVLLGGLLAFLVFRGSPRDTADAFMSALQAKDVDKAHSLLCRDGQQKESKEELRRSFDLEARTITRYVLGTERERQREGEDETLVPVTITYDQGAEVQLDIGVWDQGAGEKVCSFNPPGG